MHSLIFLFVFASCSSPSVSKIDRVGGDLILEVINANRIYIERVKAERGFTEIRNSKTSVQEKGSEVTITNASDFRILFNFSADCVLFDGRTTPTTSRQRSMDLVQSINPSYCFELRKNSGSRRWELFKYLISNESDLEMSAHGFMVSLQRPSHSELANYLMPTIGAASPRFRLSAVLDQPRFELKSTEKHPDTGDVIIKFRYAVDPYTVQGSFNNISFDCELTLKADDSYLPTHLIQLAMIDDKPHRVESTVRREMNNGLVVREERESSTTVGNNEYKMTQSEISTFNYDHIPVEEFTLSAYGFPEPSELKRAGWNIPRHVWLLLIGVTMVGLALFLKIRTDRNRPRGKMGSGLDL